MGFPDDSEERTASIFRLTHSGSGGWSKG